jgi:MOSC domain-containing protein
VPIAAQSPIRVEQLWRYPVKSLAGERLPALELDARGPRFDRGWALVSPEGFLASGKDSRRFRRVPGLLHHRSAMDGDLPVVTLADGRAARAGTPELDALLAYVAPPGWVLRREAEVPHHDAAPVHLVTSATLAALSAAAGEPVAAARLRPNLLLAAGGARFAEEAWVGRTLRVGEVVLRIREPTERCVMVGHAQGALEARPRLLRTIGRVNRACAGVYADVVTAGRVAEGDVAELDPPA